MKKIFYAIVAVAAITFSACNGTVKGGDNKDSIAADSVVADAPVADVDATINALSAALTANDATQAQSLLEKAQAYIAKLQAEGKLEDAKTYLAKLQQFISENEETIAQFTAGNETLGNLVSAVKAIPTDVATVANDAAEGAKKAVVDAANDAANKAIESGKKEAGKAIDDAANAVKGKLGI